MSMKYVQYKVYPQPFTERVLDAICLRFDLDRSYFLDEYEYEKDDDYNYYVGLLCYALKVHGGLGDSSISHFLPWSSIKDVYYFLDIFKLYLDQDSSVQDELKNVLLIADQLNVKIISVPVLHVSLDKY